LCSLKNRERIRPRAINFACKLKCFYCLLTQSWVRPDLFLT